MSFVQSTSWWLAQGSWDFYDHEFEMRVKRPGRTNRFMVNLHLGV